jgi:hypothetical protein
VLAPAGTATPVMVDVEIEQQHTERFMVSPSGEPREAERTEQKLVLRYPTAGEPVMGGWFRSIKAVVKSAVSTPVGQEALLTAVHVADSRLVQAQGAYVTATLLHNVAPVLQALQPTKDAVVRAGALLIVKVDWVVQVHQLTAAQQAILDHRQQLAASPTEIIAALQLTEPVLQDGSLPSAAKPRSPGETGTAPGD